jgi:hypothetical protein
MNGIATLQEKPFHEYTVTLDSGFRDVINHEKGIVTAKDLATDAATLHQNYMSLLWGIQERELRDGKSVDIADASYYSQNGKPYKISE